MNKRSTINLKVNYDYMRYTVTVLALPVRQLSMVVQLVEALHHKPEGRVFDSDGVIGIFH